MLPSSLWTPLGKKLKFLLSNQHCMMLKISLNSVNVLQVYVWVIGSNLVLRWTWTYKLSAHLRNNYITVFIITLLEIYRRFQWAFFRIENVWYKINNPKRTITTTSHQTNPVSLQNDNGGEQEKLLAHSHNSLGV